MSTDLHPNPEDVWVLACENPMLRASLSPADDVLPGLFPEALCQAFTPTSLPHFLQCSLWALTRGNTLELLTAPCIPGPCDPPSGQNLTPGVEIWVGSGSRMALFRQQQQKWGLEGEGSRYRWSVSREKQASRGTLGSRPPATARNAPRQCWPLTPAHFSSGSTAPTTLTSRTSSHLWSNWGITIATRPDRMGVGWGCFKVFYCFRT